MCEGIAFAHSHGVKVYVTVNILAHNRDLEGVREYLQELKEIGPDALIIADPGIFMYAKEICPRSSVTSVHRQIIPIMRLTVSGITLVPNVW